MPRTTPLLLSSLLALAAPRAQAPEETLLLQSPTISAQHIVFVYAGDLWVVGRSGGDARRLTSSSGVESLPRLSPDGSMVAFSAQYDGNTDVYVIPVMGGAPRRLTWHPGSDSVCDWHPDGDRVLFRSSRHSGSRYQKAFLVSLEGGLPEPLPLPRVAHMAYDADGSHIAYTSMPDAFRSWKRYRGGRTPPVWIYDVKTHEVEEIPHINASDTFPSWVGQSVYFGSDRDRVMNIWRYRPGSGEVEQVTKFTDFHVRNMDADGDTLVVEQAGALHVYTPAAGLKRLSIRCVSDGVDSLPRWQTVEGHVRGASIAPNGQRAVFEARGELISMPREHGAPRNLTNSPGAHDRDPAWSPDGKHIAWFSDARGEYELAVQDHEGRDKPRYYRLDGGGVVGARFGGGNLREREVGGFYYSPRWSPDSKHILFQDKFNRLATIELENGNVTRVCHQQGSLGVLRIDAEWSPDGAWVAYTERDPNTAYDSISLFEVATGRRVSLTDGFANAGSPRFSTDGKFLFFAGSIDAGRSRFGLDLSTSAARQPSTRLYVAVLSADAPNPLAPREDSAVSEKGGDRAGQESGEKAGEKPGENAGEKADAAPETSIDVEGLDQRILALPVSDGRYGNLLGIENGVMFVDRENGGRLRRFDFKSRKADTVMEGVRNAMMAAGGKHLLISTSRGVEIAAINGKDRKPLNVDNVKVRVDPKQEWPQMLREAWRLQRDYFYDPNLHGVDWPAMWRRWKPFVDHVRHRSDLNMVIAELIGELACGHQYVSGGELPDGPDGIAVGLLGADYEVVSGRYRIQRILRGQNWNPGLRAPLTEPGVRVNEGDFILAVDGVPLDASSNIHEAFASRAEQRVEILVSANADGSGARTETVVPVRSERQLRQMSWIESRRAIVDRLSGGRLAYVYMPNTAGAGLASFERDFYSQLNREGLVLDERYNGGGKVADHVIEVLSRDVMCYWMNREGWVAKTPFASFDGPKVMVINETAGSGGDAMPWLFRNEGIGKLVGTRTWGGLVGISGYPPLMDGGSVTAASFGVMSKDGDWAVENIGVAPDIEVHQWPKDVIEGRDPQLERAVQVALEALEDHVPAKKPVYVAPTGR